MGIRMLTNQYVENVDAIGRHSRTVRITVGEDNQGDRRFIPMTVDRDGAPQAGDDAVVITLWGEDLGPHKLGNIAPVDVARAIMYASDTRPTSPGDWRFDSITGKWYDQL